MDNEKMPYHLTITDNETGEVMLDTDSYAIIGSVGVENGASSVGFTNCDIYELAVAVQAAEGAVAEVKRGEPKLRMLVRLHRRLSARRARKARTA